MASTSAARRPATSAPGDGSRTITVRDSQPIPEGNNPGGEAPNGILRLRGGPRSRPRVMWDADVIDNEGCGKKKSKICCIYHKPRRFDESSSESSGDESDSSCGSNDSRKHAHKRPDKAGDPNPGPNAYEKSGSKGKGKAAINRLRSGQSKFELVHRPNGSWPGTNGPHISVLDSSFNPRPTRMPPWPLSRLSYPSHQAQAAAPSLHKQRGQGSQTRRCDPEQRLEMMVALAQKLGQDVAVGAVNEPTFVGKSEILREHCSDTGKPELTFLMGWDTIVRFFAPRYYPSPSQMLSKLRTFFNEEGSSIVCARRGSHPDTEEEEFLRPRKIKITDLDQSVRDISSTDVRKGTIETAERYCSKEVVEIIKREQLYFWN
ncbi:Type 1 phosphatases regulator YPI1 [Rhizoctonia solani]|uniref:Type 1 phosphatases regulator n=1 Tax=Rhizoctonia solani TaxID=456999 RepID=A0A8H8STC0_9AGAM|nr:Type 1 phosphatases regulator YPI1 [Rhizoctonia solani]QRW17711.1 Type 1 phosphatases regulator YPI1 [Rhizoctonia solani]